MTSRPPLAALAAVAACAALLAGCQPTSSSGKNVSTFKGEQRQVAQAVADFQKAASSDDDNVLCRDHLAKALADRLAAHGKGCPAVVHEAIRNADSLDMTVQSVRVDGQNATARVKLETGKKDRTVTLPLVREGGRWRIAGL
jgi:ABC-type uncharacterized transport system auxiliary subunit